MSQSPIDDFSPRATTRYRQGWKALDRLLHEDQSFSGRERNCVYLNLGKSPAPGEFANISAVSGLDFADDGRAVATVDWDFDGDLDLWIASRTAPRIRLVRNDHVSGNHFLAVRLRGDGRRTNRDAIGARLELVLSDRPQGTLIKTLHAGDGFLTQSSKWIHFGLGSATEIKRLIVHWPGGKQQQYTELRIDQRYLIDQQSGQPIAWQPPSGRKKLVASKPDLPLSNQQARIVLSTRLPLPSLTTANGRQVLSGQINGPTLINLWSVTCVSCLKELSDWSRSATQLRALGLDVVAVNLDSFDEPSPEAQRALEEIDFPFRSCNAARSLVHSLDVFQRAMLDRWQPLPVPTSFLVDGQGQIAVVYKGRLRMDQLLDDIALLDAPPAQLRDHATPFPGHWIADPPEPDPLRVTSQFIDRAMVDAGVDYLQRYAQGASTDASDGEQRSWGDVFYVLATLLREQRQSDAAQTAYRKALEYNPDDFRVHSDLASVLAEHGQLDSAAERLVDALRIKPGDLTVHRKLALLRMRQQDYPAAIELFSQVVRARPKDVASWFNLANAYRFVGRYAEALQHYRQTLRVQPQMTLAANNMAWMLATHPDGSLRDGKEAVRLAESLCERTEYRRPEFLDTLAVAYAEVGEFDKAIETAQQAISRWTKAGKANDARAIQQRLELFNAHRPYRDTRRAVPPAPAT